MFNRDNTFSDDVTQYVCIDTQEKVLVDDKKNIQLSFALEVGTFLLGKYRILKILKENQFGFVYLVETNEVDKKRCIIKEFFPIDSVIRGKRNQMLIRAGLSANELINFNFMKKIFMGEAHNLSEISLNKHPNIVNFIALEENINNTSYLVMSYEEGDTLAEYLKKREGSAKHWQNNVLINQIIDPLLDALEHIHKLKIYHLNIKPENIIIRLDGTPVLIGFQASTIYYDEDTNKYCNAYTPKYASAEQIKIENIAQVDHRSDIYSMGALLYYLITGTLPVKAYDRIKSIMLNKNGDPYVPLVSQALPTVYNISLLRAVDKALNFSKKNRFRSADKFRNAIFGTKSLSNQKLPQKKVSNIYLFGLFATMLSGLIYFGWNNFSDKSNLPLAQNNNIKLKNDSSIVLNVDHKADNKSGKINDKNIKLSSSIEQQKVPLMKEEVKTNQQSPKAKKSQKEDPEIISEASNMELNSEEEKVSSNIKNIVLETKEKPPVVTPVNNVKVQIDVRPPVKIGKTQITVNGNELIDNRIIAYKGNKYQISVTNPYYYDINAMRTFEELKEFPLQTFIPVLGKAKIYLSGLPSELNIKVFESKGNKIQELKPEILYKNKMYEMILPSGKKHYMTFNKKGYKQFKTEIQVFQNGKALTRTYHLEKNDVIEKKETAISSINKVEKNNQLDTNISSSKENISVPKRKIVIKKTDNKREKKKNIKNTSVKVNVDKKVKSKSKTKKSIIKQKKPNVKKKNIVKNKPKELKKSKSTSKQSTSGLVWYCYAKAIGINKVSAKHTNKQTAQREAMLQCRRKNKAQVGCRLQNCFLLRK